MKKKLGLYLGTIFFAVIMFSLIFSGKVEAATYSKTSFQMNVPSTYSALQNTSTIIKLQSANGRNAIVLESYEEKTSGTIVPSKFLDIVKDAVNNVYSGANITSAKTIEKEASVCADVLFNRTANGSTAYYEVYSIKSDNYLTFVTFLSYDKSFLTSSEKTNMWNSFKIKDTVTVSYGLPFTDVPSKAWYRSAVEYVYENKIMSGGTYKFTPGAKLSRAMMVTILYNMEGNPKASGTSPFKDVKDSKKWYYSAVLWAAKNRVVSGYPDGRFGPNDDITREQLAVMLCNYARYKKKNVSKVDNLTKYADANKVGNYAKSSVKWAVATGVITGGVDKNTGKYMLNPKGNATRAEAASMIYKYCMKVGR